MLSLTRVNAGQASSYYTADDYYLQEVGHWYGQLSQALGYTGTIKENDFQNLIEGIDPKGRFEIQHGGKDNIHTAGVDLTFSAPKSVSIAGLVLDNKVVIDAHSKAVNTTLSYIEKNYTNVRVKEHGQVHTEHTGNLLVAKFQHMSSRELDPQLHTHCLVMNFTAKGNGDIRAMDYREIYDSKMLLGQIYRSELAANLKELGYTIESNSKGLFEIKGIPSELANEFSTRSEQISQRFEELKERFPTANHAELKAMAAIDTRKVKAEPSMEELKQSWNERIAKLNINKQYLSDKLTSHRTNSNTNINNVIDKAILIATEHEAVVRAEDILRVATKISLGEYRVNELQATLDNNCNIIKLDNKNYTTLDIADIERKIVSQVLEGQGNALGISEAYVQNQIHHYEADNGFKLTNGQRQAVVHILGSKDMILGIQGDAGTGKTTMLDVVRTIANKSDLEVMGLSFTGKAASEIEDASQIQSRTIASLIGSGDTLKSKLVVIDEASMLSIKDIQSLLDRCDDKTKLVLIGDTKQLQTIGQGKIFSSLQEKGVINTVHMSEVQRQNDPDYKDVVDNFSAKKIDVAFAKLEQKNQIREIQNRDDRLSAITKEYLTKPKETIIVTAINKDREALNDMIREELRNIGVINSNEIVYLTRDTKNLIGVEKFYNENYSIGDVVIANKDKIFGKAGSEAKIIEVNRESNSLKVRSTIDGRQSTIDLKHHGGDLQLYTEKSKAFAEGDKILFLKNDKGLGVKNGQTGYITGISKDNMLNIKMDNNKELKVNPNTQYRYIGHGYALTDYKSQGQTQRHVIYHADTDRVVNYNQAYVGITRGKESVKIYTNDKIALIEHVKQEQQKTTTLDHNLKLATSPNKKRLQEITGRVPSTRDKVNSLNKSSFKELNPTVQRDVSIER